VNSHDYLAVSLKSGEQIVSGEVLSKLWHFSEARRASDLWSHWKKARKMHWKYCVCSKTTAYKETGKLLLTLCCKIVTC